MILLQGSPAGIQNMIFLVGIVIVFYFFMIRPQQKKQKEAKKFRDNLKKGDNIITTGGIVGKVASVEGEYAHIEVDRGMKLKMQKSSIASELKAETAPSK